MEAANNELKAVNQQISNTVAQSGRETGELQARLQQVSQQEAETREAKESIQTELEETTEQLNKARQHTKHLEDLISKKPAGFWGHLKAAFSGDK